MGYRQIVTSMVFDAGGNLYAATPFYNPRLLKLDSTGATVASYNIAQIAPGESSTPFKIDLAADQCTLFFTGESNAIGRFDVCRGVRLPDFALLDGSYPQDLRLLSDGTVLVAALDRLVRLAANGTVMRTYSAELSLPEYWYSTGWTALAIDPAGTTFWAGRDRRVIQFDLNNGQPITGFFTEYRGIGSLVVVGEPRAATASTVAVANVPALSPAMQAALAIALLFLGWAVIRAA